MQEITNKIRLSTETNVRTLVWKNVFQPISKNVHRNANWHSSTVSHMETDHSVKKVIQWEVYQPILRKMWNEYPNEA